MRTLFQILGRFAAFVAGVLRVLVVRFPVLARVLNVAGLAVLIGVLWPVDGVPPPSPVTLVITATGAKAAAAGGSEVWLAQMPPEVPAEKLALAQKPAGSWSVRHGLYVSHLVQPATITWSGVLGPERTVKLARHPWAGRARVEIEGGSSREVDLYAPGPIDPLSVSIDELRPAPTFRWSTYFGNLLRVSGLLFLPLFVVASALAHQVVSPPEGVSDWGDLRWRAAQYAVPSLVIFGLVLLATWPAQMTSDSISQWEELASGRFTNGHPLVHTLLLGWPGYVLGRPALSTALQIFLFAAAIGLVLAEMTAQGMSRGKAWVAAVLLPLFPPIHTLSTVFWKDIPYTIALIAVFWCLLVLSNARRLDVMGGRGFSVALASALFLAGTFRHNGLIVSAVIAILIVVLFRGVAGKCIIRGALIGGLVAPVLWTYALLPALSVPGVARHFGGAIPMHGLAFALKKNLIEDATTIARLESIMPREKWTEKYVCRSIVPLFFQPGLPFEKIDASLFGPLLPTIARHPVAMSEHYACITSLLWRLSPTTGAVHGLTPLQIPKTPAAMSLGLEYSPLSSTLAHVLTAEFSATTGSELMFAIFWRPASVLCLLLAFVVMYWRTLAWKSHLLLVSPIVLNTMSQVPLITSQDYRYQFPVVVLCLLLSWFLFQAPPRSGAVASQGTK